MLSRMRTTARLLALVVLTVAVPATGHAHDLAELLQWMTGSFSSAAQAERDESYFDIRLQMWPIWPEHTTPTQGWLYVEQAMAGREDAPYRQRVYRVRDLGEGQFESAVFTIPGGSRFFGDWRDENPLATLTPDSLVEREGCAITLEHDGDHTFVGSTDERECPSDLRGAAYATSVVRITEHGLDSWDRGFDAEGVLVWGAEFGPYEFRRIDSGRTDD